MFRGRRQNLYRQNLSSVDPAMSIRAASMTRRTSTWSGALILCSAALLTGLIIWAIAAGARNASAPASATATPTPAASVDKPQQPIDGAPTSAHSKSPLPSETTSDDACAVAAEGIYAGQVSDRSLVVACIGKDPASISPKEATAACAAADAALYSDQLPNERLLVMCDSAEMTLEEQARIESAHNQPCFKAVGAPASQWSLEDAAAYLICSGIEPR
jgi:hypothetical protein